jgi:hypothetical protein
MIRKNLFRTAATLALAIALAAPANAQTFRRPAEPAPTPAAPQIAPPPQIAPAPATPAAADPNACRQGETEFVCRIRRENEAAAAAERKQADERRATEQLANFKRLAQDRADIGAISAERLRAELARERVSDAEHAQMLRERTAEMNAWTDSVAHRNAVNALNPLANASPQNEFRDMIGRFNSRRFLSAADVKRLEEELARRRQQQQQQTQTPAPAAAAPQPAPADQAAPAPQAQAPVRVLRPQQQQAAAAPAIVAQGQIERIDTTSRVMIAGRWLTLSNIVGSPTQNAIRAAGDHAWTLGNITCRGTVDAAECVAADGKNLAIEFVQNGWAQIAATAPANFVNAARR